jgi:RNA polymerase sigma factor (sigma-70 family)
MMISNSDAEVYEKHADELIRFATILAGPFEAEDVVANAVVNVFASPSWQHARNQRAYLYRSVMREAAMLARGAHRRTAREQRVGAWAQDAPQVSLRPEVIDAMRSLSVRQRAVVFMTFWLDAPADEIALLLSVSSRTVQRDLATSYEKMGSYLDE